MRVKLLGTGKIEEFNDSAANRLIEQGKAIIAPKKAVSVKTIAVKPETPEKPEKAEKKGAGKKSGKGD